MLQQRELFGPPAESRVCCLKLGAGGGIHSQLLTLTGQIASKKKGHANLAIATPAKAIQTQPPMDRKCMCKNQRQHWRASSGSLGKARSDPFDLLNYIFRHRDLKNLQHLFSQQFC